MQTAIRRCSFLSYFLIPQIVFYPLFAVAGEVSSSSDRAVQVPVKLKTAVVELNDGKAKSDAVEKVADTLRDELSHREGFEVLAKEATLRFFETSPDLRAGESNATGLNRYLEQAKEYYKSFNFKEAVGVLENTIDTYRNSGGTLAELFLLTDAYLLLGNIHMGNNDPRAAQEAFREAVRLDPDREITELQYPPKTVAAFQKARVDFLKKAKSSSLEIQSASAKANVFLNGDLKGQTPLKLERWTTGEQFLLVQAPGYQAQGKKLNLKTEGAREKISLQRIVDPAVNRHGLTVTSLQDVPEQVRLGGQIGKSLGLDKVVMVSLEEIGWNNKITARMIDVKYRASHKAKSVEVLDLPKDTRSASHVIATDLSEASHLDLAKDPKKYADGEVMVIGSKKKKSFLKSPLLWGLVGVVVAGGATGAMLLGKGGGGGGGGGDNATVTLSGAAGRAP